MQNYCTSLEVSKRLKAAGWSKTTNFYHIQHKDINLPGYKNCVMHGRTGEFDMYPEPYWNLYPSPHSAEILEDIETLDILVYIAEMRLTPLQQIDLFKSVNALAECWMWAKEKGLIK